jgi:hypothetical protein
LRYAASVKSKVLWPVVLILVFAVSRWPGLMPQNFSAAYALCFCAGLYLPRRLAWSLPLGVMLLTDVFLTFLHYHPEHYSWLAFVRDQAPSYAAYALVIGLGCVLGRKRSFLTLLSGGILGAILFYLLTNTASWLTDAGYQKTLADWFRALTVGKPGYPATWEFFRGTFLSGGIFTGLFVGAMKMTEASDESPAENEEPEEEESGEAEPSLTPAPAEDTGHPAAS